MPYPLPFSHHHTHRSFGVLLFEISKQGATPYGSLGLREIVEMINAGQRLKVPPETPALVKR